MAILFIIAIMLYYYIFFKVLKIGKESVLVLILFYTYFALGGFSIIFSFSDINESTHYPNYFSTVLLSTSIGIMMLGFSNFKTSYIENIFNGRIRNQKKIENALIIIQLYSISFFLPFALQSMTGDIGDNRLLLEGKANVLASYGIFNTVASAGSHLFTANIVLAACRLNPKRENGRNISRAFILIITSLSYAIYILAYVGRDGVVFWLMNIIMVYLIFSSHLTRSDKKKIQRLLGFIVTIIFIAFFMITISRFSNSDSNISSGILGYFGMQINNYSDYSSIDRPLTYGRLSFPLFYTWGCDFLSLNCQDWISQKEDVFQVYLDQDTAPWMFGTFFSDFDGDFGTFGALILVSIISLISAKVCFCGRTCKTVTFPRLLLIIFLFQIPYWGVFYFRYAAYNSFIVNNLLFILMISIMQLRRKE
jgi:hypothetical protein